MFGKTRKLPDQAGREFFLHLGLHKTATTALQDFLFRIQKELHAQDVRYLPLKRMRAEVTPLLCQADQASRLRLFDLLDAFPNRKFLLSDENLLGNANDIRIGSLYPFAGNRVLSFCEDVAPAKVTLFLTLRDPSSFLTSMYCEYIRHNNFLSFEEYTEAFEVAGFSYQQTFGWLKKLPENARLQVTPFESDLGGGVMAITERILAAVAGDSAGFDLGQFPKSKSRSSYSQEEIDLATTISAQAGPKMAQIFLNVLDAKNKRFGTTRFLPFSPAVTAEMNARYRSELAAFA